MPLNTCRWALDDGEACTCWCAPCGDGDTWSRNETSDQILKFKYAKEANRWKPASVVDVHWWCSKLWSSFLRHMSINFITYDSMNHTIRLLNQLVITICVYHGHIRSLKNNKHSTRSHLKFSSKFMSKLTLWCQQMFNLIKSTQKLYHRRSSISTISLPELRTFPSSVEKSSQSYWTIYSQLYLSCGTKLVEAVFREAELDNRAQGKQPHFDALKAPQKPTMLLMVWHV